MTPTFEEFWQAYPKKKGKAAAKKAWEKIPEVLHGDVIAALQQQARQDTQFKRYTPHASTWLNQQRWEDEIDSSLPSSEGSRHFSGHSVPNHHDGRCEFSHNGTRCLLPGNVCNGPSRAPGPWYCLWHSQEANRGHGPEQDEFFRIYGKPENAREHVEMTYESPLLALRDALITENPEWRRMPSEAKSAYQARMRAECRALLSKVRDKQVP